MEKIKEKVKEEISKILESILSTIEKVCGIEDVIVNLNLTDIGVYTLDDVDTNREIVVKAASETKIQKYSNNFFEINIDGNQYMLDFLNQLDSFFKDLKLEGSFNV